MATPTIGPFANNFAIAMISPPSHKPGCDCSHARGNVYRQKGLGPPKVSVVARWWSRSEA